MHYPKRILRLDASANPADSNSRKLGDHLLQRLQQEGHSIEVRVRDLNQDLSFIDDHWIAANFTAVEDRDCGQSARLRFRISSSTNSGGPTISC